MPHARGSQTVFKAPGRHKTGKEVENYHDRAKAGEKAPVLPCGGRLGLRAATLTGRYPGQTDARAGSGMLCSPASASQAAPPEVKGSEGSAQSLPENTGVKKAAGFCGRFKRSPVVRGYRQKDRIFYYQQNPPKSRAYYW